MSFTKFQGGFIVSEVAQRRPSLALVATFRDQVRPKGYYVALACLVIAIPLTLIGAAVPAFVVAMIALGALLYAQWQSTLLLAFSVYALAGSLFSNVLIERGAYVAEQFRTGAPNGATSLLALFCITYFLIGHAGMVAATSRFRSRLALSEAALTRLGRILQIGFGAAVAFYVVMIASFGNAWQLAGQRYEFWSKMPTLVAQPAKVLHYFLIPAAIAILAFYAYSRSLRRSDWLTLVFAGLVQVGMFMLGERFSGYVQELAFVAMGIAIGGLAKQLSAKATKRLLVAAILAPILLMATAAAGYRAYGVSDVPAQLSERTVLQGHVWYGIYTRERQGAPLIPISDMVRPNGLSTPSGVDRLGLEIAPRDFVLGRMARGISFTLGGPAAMLAVFGPIVGLVLFGLSSLAYAAVMWATLALLSRGWFALAILAIAATRSVTYVVLMGNWADIYHPMALISYVVLAVAIVIDRKKLNSVDFTAKLRSVLMRTGGSGALTK